MVVILCHWLCNALCAKSSVNSNSSMHNHVGILKGKEVSSDVCCRDKHPRCLHPHLFRLWSFVLWSSRSFWTRQDLLEARWWVNATSHSHSLAIKLPYTQILNQIPCYLATSASIWCTEESSFYFNAKKMKIKVNPTMIPFCNIFINICTYLSNVNQ